MATSATSSAAAPSPHIEKAGATWERMAVPGALEIPGAIAMAHETGLYHGYVALGCVLRGETTHYDIVANESSRGIMDLTLEGLCIGNGILTCENEDQAWARAKVDEMDKGGGAAEAALDDDPLLAPDEPQGSRPRRESRLVSGNDNKYPRERRSAARLGAVQALYQMDLSGTRRGRDAGAVLRPRHGREFRGRPVRRGRLPHLKEVVDGVVREQKAIDPAVDQILDKAWPLHRLDSTVRAILRAAAYELMFMERVPARVAISEYVDVADAFFGMEEPRFVNGVLDRLARQKRPQEFAA